MKSSDWPTDLDRIFREEWGRVLATVVRLLGDLGRAEEIVQEAWLRAIERWPFAGPPDRPGAWLTTTARNLALDELRRRRRAPAEGFDEELHSPRADSEPDLEALLTPPLIRDDPLRLVFTCCHPILPREAQVALTLRTLGGLTTREIARAFLQAEAAVAQRIVRAKRTLREREVDYRVPSAWELPERLPAVLHVLYLIFNEGYAAREGDAPQRVDLMDEAIRLAQLVAELMPGSEVLALLALMELQASRAQARLGEGEEPVRLEDQDRSRWNRERIASGLAHLAAARGKSSSGRFLLQAEIAACHASAVRFEATDWKRIVGFYDALLDATGSPVVALNRAVAVSMAKGPAAGLALVEALADESRLDGYAWLPATRADLLRRLGRLGEALTEYARALELTENGAERAFLARRMRECGAPAH